MSAIDSQNKLTEILELISNLLNRLIIDGFDEKNASYIVSPAKRMKIFSKYILLYHLTQNNNYYVNLIN